MHKSARYREIQRQVDAFTEQYGHPPRVMLFVETERTFGHARIASTLAKRIREMGGEVIVVSGDIDEQIFDFEGTLRKLPRIDRATEGNYTPDGSLYEDRPDYQKLRTDKVMEIARDFKPDIAVFEFHPLSYNASRVPDVDAVAQYRRESGAPLPIVTIARDDCATLEFTEQRRERLKPFDHLLVEGYKENTPTPGIVPEPEQLGHILADRPPNDHPLPSEKQPVMVFSSGGYKPSDQLFFDKAIEASKQSLFADQPWKIVLSNDCPDEVFRAFEEKARIEGSGKITVMRSYNNEDFSYDIANCKAAIVRGSYNATLELASQHKPFVVIPRTLRGWSYENENRARFFSEHGIAAMITEAELEGSDGAGKLAGKLLEATQVKPTHEIDYEDGSQFAARFLQLAMQHKQAAQVEQSSWEARGQRRPGTMRR